jgi:hypothetical protein
MARGRCLTTASWNVMSALENVNGRVRTRFDKLVRKLLRYHGVMGCHEMHDRGVDPGLVETFIVRMF